MITMMSESAIAEMLENLDLPLATPARPQEAAPGHGEFKMLETAALLSRKQADLLLEEVGLRMKPAYPESYTLIASHYFDSNRLALFRQHFLQAPKRYKLRINRYAADGTWNDEAPVIELKSYENGVSKKKRISLTPDNYALAMGGNTMKMTDELLALNPETDRENLLIWLGMMNGLIAEHRLKPALKLLYKRYAFDSSDRLRLTLDTDLNIEMLDLDVNGVAGTRAVAGRIWDEAERVASEYGRGRNRILKLKHSGSLPRWIEAFLQGHKIENMRFSKYCWAVNEAAGPGATLPEALEGRILPTGAY